MKHFVIHNAAGEILRAGICQDETFELQAQGPDEFVIETQADVETDAVNPQTREIVKGGRPPEPIDMDYRKARLGAYPGVNEQLDMLWHAMDEFHMPRVEPFYSRLKVVKEAYPKDNSVVPGSVVIYGVEP
jgi:hypothetical protein